MINSINDRYLTKLERVYTVQTGHIESILVRVRPLLVMRIDPTNRAKVVLRCHGIELIQGQLVLPLGDLEARQFNRGCYRATPSAHRTIAPTRLLYAVG
jgi:hypothetical protein